jgi:DNA polymerase elongation subunit (family B)
LTKEKASKNNLMARVVVAKRVKAAGYLLHVRQKIDYVVIPAGQNFVK